MTAEQIDWAVSVIVTTRYFLTEHLSISNERDVLLEELWKLGEKLMEEKS